MGPNEKTADVGGWVTINNNSGKKYENAKLKLIAGEVNTVRNNNYPTPPPVPYAMMTARSAPPPSFSQKSFSDFHMYTLSIPVTINENSQKQV